MSNTASINEEGPVHQRTMIPRQVVFAYDRTGAPPAIGHRFCPDCGAVLDTPPPQGGHQLCTVCGQPHYKNPAPGVVILIVRDDEVLLGKRAAESHGGGSWCLPGGYVEYGEDFLSAARREVREETGLEVEITAIVSVVSNFLAPNLHTLVVVLSARVVGGSEQAGDDLDELIWHPLSGPLPKMAFEADSHIIERHRRTNLTGAPVDPLYAAPAHT